MKIIGFDYDGTIINIEPQKAKAFGLLLEKEWGIGPLETEKFWIATGGTSRRYKFDYFYDRKFNKKLNDGLYNEVESKFSNILKTKFYPKIEVLSDALPLLEFARSRFDYVFVSSGVTHDEIKHLVGLNGLKKYFNAVYGTNNKYLSKADHFKEIIGSKKPDVKIFVGDGLEDMKIAKKFGFIAIGIPTNHKVEELKQVGADHVTDLKDCMSLIDKTLLL